MDSTPKSIVITLPQGVEQYEQDIRRFVDAMCYKLGVHAAKGRWEDLPLDRAVELMKGEIAELEEAITSNNTIEVLLESADVSNFAMIIASIFVERGK